MPYKDPGESVERIKLFSPEVSRELRGRIAAKRLYDPEMVRDLWLDVKWRLLKDGEEADLSDLVPHRAKSAKRERRKALAEE